MRIVALVLGSALLFPLGALAGGYPPCTGENGAYKDRSFMDAALDPASAKICSNGNTTMVPIPAVDASGATVWRMRAYTGEPQAQARAIQVFDKARKTEPFFKGMKACSDTAGAPRSVPSGTPGFKLDAKAGVQLKDVKPCFVPGAGGTAQLYVPSLDAKGNVTMQLATDGVHSRELGAEFLDKRDQHVKGQLAKKRVSADEEEQKPSKKPADEPPSRSAPPKSRPSSRRARPTAPVSKDDPLQNAHTQRPATAPPTPGVGLGAAAGTAGARAATGASGATGTTGQKKQVDPLGWLFGGCAQPQQPQKPDDKSKEQPKDQAQGQPSAQQKTGPKVTVPTPKAAPRPVTPTNPAPVAPAEDEKQ